MKIAIIKKSFITVACMVFLLVGCLIMASASTFGSITAHTVPANSTTLYWNGTNGCYMYSYSYMDFLENFNASYPTYSGYYYAGSGYNQVSSGTGSGVYWSSDSVKIEGLYKAYIHNSSASAMNVTGGYLSTT